MCDFSNGDSLPAVAQAAIAHAQFETVHPFIDGNGRTGGALIHVILRRRCLALRLPGAGIARARYLGVQFRRGPADSSSRPESHDEQPLLVLRCCTERNWPRRSRRRGL
ncbi:MAG: Fic family protein [Chloroflexota bacterium]